MKKTLAILLSFVMLFSVAASCLSTVAYAADAANTISITNGADFQKIGKDSAFPLSGNYVLANDITITDTAYAPIGDYTNRFTGTFDGNNKKITVDLTYEKTEVTGYNTQATASYVGLFGCVEGATIKNLTVTGTMDITAVSAFIGGIVGGSYGVCTFDNLVSDVDMDIDCVAGNSGATDFVSFMGGAIGRIMATGTSTQAVSVTNVINKGNLNITNGNTTNAIGGDSAYKAGGRGGLGGIVGLSDEYIAITLDHCVNYGNITIDYGTHNTGGVLGAGPYTSTKGKSITMTWCANHGNLTRTTQKYDRVCGLLGAGMVKVSMEYCMNTGEISDTNPGFIGFFGKGDNYARYCVNTATLKNFFEKYAATDRTNQEKCGYNATVSDTTTVPSGSGTVLAVSSTAPLDVLYEALTENYKGTDLEGKLKMGTVDGKADIYFDFENPEAYEIPAIEIDSVEELLKIGKDANYPAGSKYVLTTDLTITSENWAPIGTYAAPFTGYFDGNDKTITVDLTYTNLTATNTVAGCAYVGLFGVVREGTVADLTVEGTMDVTTICGYIGGVVGATFGGSLLNGVVSKVDMNIVLDQKANAELTNPNDHVSFIGGVVGIVHQLADNGNESALVSNCINMGDIEILSATSGNVASAASDDYDIASKGGYGGVIGASGKKGSSEMHITVNNCINYGDLHVNQGPQNIGGVMGLTACADSATVYMNYCANYGNISRDLRTTDRVSALFGYARYCYVNYCFNAGTISDSNTTSFVGFISKSGTVENSFSVTPVGYFLEAHTKAPETATCFVPSDATITYNDDGTVKADYTNGATKLNVASTDGQAAFLNALIAAMSDEQKAVFTVYGIADAQGNGATIAFAEEKPTGITAMGYQVTDVDATAGTYNIRFASIVDSLRYNAVGYEIVATYVENGETVTKTFDKQCGTVYTALTGSVNGTTAEYTVVGDYYIVALAITGVPADVGEVTYTVKPYTVTNDVKTYGEAQTVTYAPAN